MSTPLKRVNQKAGSQGRRENPKASTATGSSINSNPTKRRVDVSNDPSSSKKRKTAVSEITTSFDRLVPILVGAGEEQRTISVHEDKVIRRSPYLREAFAALERSVFVDDKTTIIDLSNHSTRIVLLYFHWCYSNESLKPDSKTAPVDDDLVQVWLLRQFLRCCELQNAAIQLCLKVDGTGVESNA
ncbi:hypothetical protein GLAREA_04412 [Glarea lozoyensis ATCC 20868]|uniref:BTB domain-containing protein n=1 Tax=Glarea lozoyensis (strain ATCC 20868 / MF5171) TaxID=1116229 RepID=S3D6D7_GLAL2|nr:uncharacterized protein GLAREA_04412 [Glarea lozoyensis ATCC 20868]EPE27621.1 hypothetical protein GLAREA_04412 [Glarea lozoyensis ATCC 20868]